MRFSFGTIALLQVFALFVSCNEEAEPEIIENVSDKLELLAVSSGALEPAFNPFVYNYQITSLNSLTDIKVILQAVDPHSNIELNGKRVENNNISLKLASGEDIVIKVGRKGLLGTYTIKYLPEEFPQYTINADASVAEGQIFFSQISSGANYSYLAIINKAGEPLYYKKVNSVNTGDFKKTITTDGKTRYSYIKSEIRAFQPGGGFRGTIVVMDENFNEIKTISQFPTVEGVIEWPENHDFILIDDDHYIVPSYVLRRDVDLNPIGINRKTDVIDLVIQEVKNNVVVFEWNSKSHLEFLENTHATYKQQLLTSPNPIDYLHFNSIFIDPQDTHFIISARHMNQVFKINRISGEIIWRLGGTNDDFGLDQSSQFSHQHHATLLSNGNLLLFDNGNTNVPSKSRVLEFSLDEVAKKATLEWEFAPERYSNFMGSAQRINGGNTFIGMGGNSTSYIEADKSDIMEITNSGQIVFELSFLNQPQSIFSYRAFKYE